MGNLVIPMARRVKRSPPKTAEDVIRVKYINTSNTSLEKNVMTARNRT